MSPEKQLEARPAGTLAHRSTPPAVAPFLAAPAAAGTRGAPALPTISSFTAGQRARWTLGAMVGRSTLMERLFLQLRYLASHLRVGLIEGEPGTGKQLTASTLHALRGAGAGSFVACSAFAFLTEAASADRLEQARGGTLYLTDVDALNPEQQGRLLHLVGWMGQRDGSRRHSFADPAPALYQSLPSAPALPRVLLVSSSRSLRVLVSSGNFRSDLFQHLSAVRLVLPPLRERQEDLPMLVSVLLQRFATSYGKQIQGVAEDVLPALLAHPWPGNVAELAAVLDRAALRATQPQLERADLRLNAIPALEAERGTAAAATLTADLRSASPVAPSVIAPTIRHLMPPRTLHAPSARQASPQPARVAHSSGASAPPAVGSGAQASTGLSGLASPGVPSNAARLALHLERQWSNPDAVPVPGQSSGRGASFVPPFEGASAAALDPNLDRAILRHVRQVLGTVNGNKLRAARLLGISRSTLYRLLESETAPIRMPLAAASSA